MDRKILVEQVGFRKGRWTRDQIVNLRQIMKKPYGNTVYTCFIDYKKAFDCVNHGQLWNTLRMMDIPEHITVLIKNLHEGQEAVVRTQYGETEQFKANKGVRQECILSPFLFNLYGEQIMRTAGLEDVGIGVKMDGRVINNMCRRYHDHRRRSE